MATGLLAEPPRVSLAPGEKPDEAVVVLGLKEARTGLFQPAIGWSSLEGWSGSLAFKETNLFGLAHQVSLDLAFIQNDARDNLSFSAAYTVPWLYLDYLDLKEVRTSLAFSLYSTPIGNTKLLDGTTDTGWEYTERRTGASLSLSRPSPATSATCGPPWGFPSGAPPTSWRSTTPTPPATPPARTQAPLRPPGASTYKDPTHVRTLLPDAGWTVRLDTTLAYLDVDDPRFRTQGYEASLATGLGLSLPDAGGRSFFVPLVATGKTYLPLDAEKRQALAFRLSAGTLLGYPPESERFYLSGGGSEALLLRGYEDRKYGGLSFATASVEYRYDFRLSPQGGTNLYGILFTDLGLADNTGG